MNLSRGGQPVRMSKRAIQRNQEITSFAAAYPPPQLVTVAFTT